MLNKSIKGFEKRVFLFVIALGSAFFLSNILVTFFHLSADNPTENELIFSIQGIIFNIGIVSCIFFIWTRLDKKDIVDLGVSFSKRSSLQILKGLLFGFLGITLLFFILLFLKSIDFKMNELHPLKLILGLFSMLCVAFGEELLYRGYILQNLIARQTRTKTIIISAIIFSLAHSANSNISSFAFLNIFLIGLLFALVTIQTGNIWTSFGFHFMWNYTQGYIFGFPISGNDTTKVFEIRLINSPLLTGGEFGIEGGILCTILLIILLLLASKKHL